MAAPTDDPAGGAARDLAPLSTKILLSKREAAAVLSISVRTLTDLVAQGAIPVVRIGARLLFRRQGLEEWAEQRERWGKAVQERAGERTGEQGPAIAG